MEFKRGDLLKKKVPVLLIIRDGWGANPHPEHTPYNAVKQARTPCSDRLSQQWPRTFLATCGRDVGLPPGVMGNSEVGHQNIGAGRIVDQEIVRLDKSFETGQIDQNPHLHQVLEHVKNRNTPLHLMGLLSDGGVHAHTRHVIGLLEAAQRAGLKSVFIHAFTDGRDTGPQTAPQFMAAVQAACDRMGLGEIVSLIGRYWAMDRDQRWERIQKAYHCLTGHSAQGCTDLLQTLQNYYAQPQPSGMQGDEFLMPAWKMGPDQQPLGRIGAGAGVIFFNFRGDRPRELCQAFLEPNFKEFQRGPLLQDLCFATLTEYQSGLCPCVLFPKPPPMDALLGSVLSERGLTQFRCAETEKYPHVTFFFNDYRDEPFAGEDRFMAPSPRDVATYDQKPEMSALAVTQATAEAILSGKYDFILVNYANADMVGHTGSLPASIQACEAVDQGMSVLLEALDQVGGKALITADHGNAEQMWDPDTQTPHTRHTLYPVEAILYGTGCQNTQLRPQGRLADIAPTLLAMMGQPIPAAMTGQSLLR